MKKSLLFLLVLTVIFAMLVRWRYGGGEAYADLSGSPAIADGELEEVLSYPEPIASVAVSDTGRVFFTVHPEARPQGNKLLEFVAGAAVPYPNIQAQQQFFDTVMGLVIDGQQRLWSVDSGNHGMRTARLLAFDLNTGYPVHDHTFDENIAPSGSYLQDLQVSGDGRTVVVADASLWRKKPALIVYDVITGTARRVLESDSSVSAEHYIIRNHGRPMTFGGGLVALRGGVDGLALDGDWLYFGAACGSGLYRLRLGDLTDASLADAELAERVERFADKPMSDGMNIDEAGNIYVTDVEHGAIMRLDQERQLSTLVKTPRIRWPNALAFGPDRWLYVADSALSEVILKSRAHIGAEGPYRIFRFRPDAGGIPGR